MKYIQLFNVCYMQSYVGINGRNEVPANAVIARVHKSDSYFMHFIVVSAGDLVTVHLVTVRGVHKRPGRDLYKTRPI